MSPVVRPTEAHPPITVYWRPGCVFCLALRRGLRRAGVTTTDLNIWGDPDAAAAVRAVADGNETVPTVAIGDRHLVNPSTRAVLEAAGIEPLERPPWWRRMLGTDR